MKASPQPHWHVVNHSFLTTLDQAIDSTGMFESRFPLSYDSTHRFWRSGLMAQRKTTTPLWFGSSQPSQNQMKDTNVKHNLIRSCMFCHWHRLMQLSLHLKWVLLLALVCLLELHMNPHCVLRMQIERRVLMKDSIVVNALHTKILQVSWCWIQVVHLQKRTSSAWWECRRVPSTNLRNMIWKTSVGTLFSF